MPLLPNFAALAGPVHGAQRQTRIATQYTLLFLGMSLPFLGIALVFTRPGAAYMAAFPASLVLVLVAFRAKRYLLGRLLLTLGPPVALALYHAAVLHAGEKPIVAVQLIQFQALFLPWQVLNLRTERVWIALSLFVEIGCIEAVYVLNPLLEYPIDSGLFQTGIVYWLLKFTAYGSSCLTMWWLLRDIIRSEGRLNEALAHSAAQNASLDAQRSQLQASEEELRQNMEEMQATQEEMRRVQQAVQQQNQHLQHMTQELEANRQHLERLRLREARLAELSERMRWRPDDQIADWGNRLLNELVPDLDFAQASLYRCTDAGLALVAAYAAPEGSTHAITFGNELLAQVVRDGSPRLLQADRELLLLPEVPAALARVRTASILLHPLEYNGEVAGVLQLAHPAPPPAEHAEYLARLTPMVAGNLLSIGNQLRLQSLLQTQRLA